MKSTNTPFDTPNLSERDKLGLLLYELIKMNCTVGKVLKNDNFYAVKTNYHIIYYIRYEESKEGTVYELTNSEQCKEEYCTRFNSPEKCLDLLKRLIGQLN